LASVAECLVALGDFAREEGQDDRAMSLYAEVLDICRAQPTTGTIASALQNLGSLALRRGEMEGAGRFLAEALATVQQLLDQRGVAECLAGIAGVAVARSHDDRAALLFGASDAAFAAGRATPWPTNRADNERSRVTARSRLGVEKFGLSYAEGQVMALERAVALALAEANSLVR
jgi:hypothetical protein